MRSFKTLPLAILMSVVAMASSGAQTAPSVLVWQFVEEKDQMTDKMSVTAVSQTTIRDGITIKTTAACDNLLSVGVSFSALRGTQGYNLAWDSTKLGLRVRMDQGNVRVAVATRRYANEAALFFYEPGAIPNAVMKTAPNVDKGNAALGLYVMMAIPAMTAKLEQVAAGKLSELDKATSIRIELPFADGNRDIVDLNPQHEAFKKLVTLCKTQVQSSKSPRTAPSAPPERKRKAANDQRKTVTLPSSPATTVSPDKKAAAQQGASFLQNGDQVWETWDSSCRTDPLVLGSNCRARYIQIALLYGQALDAGVAADKAKELRPKLAFVCSRLQPTSARLTVMVACANR
jgi:hypothetical protein